jgi:hypothetical protein
VGDIMALNPLQTVVPACGQVHLCDLGDVGKVRLSSCDYRADSVSIVLLDMHYGKRGIRSLDKLSHLPWKDRIDTEVGLT